MPDSRIDTGIDAGLLDKRVTLLAPQYNQWGDEIIGWQPAGRAWASIRPKVSQETTDGGRTITITTVDIILRFHPSLTTKWRIQDGPHTYEILSLADTGRRRERLELSCKEIT